jgi:hemerythrin superfamily protein
MAKDAINLLDADHVRVESLFRDFQSADLDPATRLDIAQVICMELTLHAMLEEELFYPAFAQATGDRRLVEHARTEHQEVMDLIAQVPNAPDVGAVMNLIQKSTMEHVEEERRDMFAKARSSGMDLDALARQLEVRKNELTTTIHQAA